MAKDKSVLTSVFVSYRAKLEYHIRSIVKPQDIDDIVQETFIKTYEAQLNNEIKYPRTFMLKTVKHLALNHIKRWDNKYNSSIEDLSEPLVNLQTDCLESELESKERFLFFCRAVDQLSGKCRKTFILKKVYGLSQKEIAHYLEISESTVEKHVAKGMLKCLDYMAELEQPEGDIVDKTADKVADKKVQEKMQHNKFL